MSIDRKITLANVMNLAWQMVKRNGYTMREALIVAWRNIKLNAAMQSRIVKFYFQKVDGTIREAYGTLKSTIVPETSSERRANPTVQTYYDTEAQNWRCFKRANLIKIG